MNTKLVECVSPCLIAFLLALSTLLVSCAIGHTDSTATKEVATPDYSDFPKVKIEFDQAAGTCSVKMEYRGKIFTKVYKNRTEEDPENKIRLLIRVDRNNLVNRDVSVNRRTVAPDISRYGKANADANPYYQITGSCWSPDTRNKNKEVKDGEVREAKQEVWLTILLPSSKLKHDSRTILSGKTPLELLNEGFTLTFPPSPKDAPSSTKPNYFLDDQLRLLHSFIESPILSEAKIKIPWNCFGTERMRLAFGTFTVPPGTTGSENTYYSPDGLRQYDVSINQWKFEGVISLNSC